MSAAEALLYDLIGEAPELDDKSLFVDFLLSQNIPADIAARISDVVFEGKSDFIHSYSSQRISELTQLWLESLNDKIAGRIRLRIDSVSENVRLAIRRKSVDEIPSMLRPEQVEFVLKAVDAGYDRYVLVNKPLVDRKEVPPFPSKEAALRSALTGLTPAQVDYMMEEGRVPFSFQVKLVAPNTRFDLVRALLDGQPKKMGTRSQRQQDLYVREIPERHLSGNKGGNNRVEWKWSFYQDAQVIGEVEAWDDVNLALEDRVSAFKAQLPEGMKGTDLFTWAASMANGLEAGKLMDIRFEGNATDTQSYEKWHFTILDEEGERTESGNRCLVGGRFNPNFRYAYLYSYRAGNQYDRARLRAAVDGSIES